MSITVKQHLHTPAGDIISIFPANAVKIAYDDASSADRLEVGYYFGPNEVLQLEPGKSSLLLDPNDHANARRLDEGTCYVMNSEGRTIGTYCLDGIDVNAPHPNFKKAVGTEARE